MAPFANHHVLVGRLSDIAYSTGLLQLAMDVRIFFIRYGPLVDVSAGLVFPHGAERLDAYERDLAFESAGVGAGDAALSPYSS